MNTRRSREAREDRISEFRGLLGIKMNRVEFDVWKDTESTMDRAFHLFRRKRTGVMRDYLVSCFGGHNYDLENFDARKADAPMEKLVQAIAKRKLMQNMEWVECPSGTPLAADPGRLSRGEAWAMVKTRSSRLRTKKRVRILIGTDSNLSPETSLALCAVIRAAEHFVNIEMVLQSAWLHPDYDIGMVLRVSSGKLDPHITAVLSISNRDTIFRDKICTGFLDEDDNYYSSGIRVANKPLFEGEWLWIDPFINLDTFDQQLLLLLDIISGKMKQYPGKPVTYL